MQIEQSTSPREYSRENKYRLLLTTNWVISEGAMIYEITCTCTFVLTLHPNWPMSMSLCVQL